MSDGAKGMFQGVARRYDSRNREWRPEEAEAMRRIACEAGGSTGATIQWRGRDVQWVVVLLTVGIVTQGGG